MSDRNLTDPGIDGRASVQRQRLRVLWGKRAVLVLAGLAVAALVVRAYMPKPVLADLASVVRGPLLVTVDEDGRTRVKDRYVVSAPIGARMARVEFEAGDVVKAGQVVARLFPSAAPILDARTRAEAEARVAATLAARGQANAVLVRAGADLGYAQKELARKRSLAERDIIAREALDRIELRVQDAEAGLTSAEFGVRVAAQELEMARAALRRFTGRGDDRDAFEIACPVDGVVLKVLTESEGVVQAGTALLEVGDPGRLEVAVDVLSQDAVHVTPGARVAVVRWGGGRALDGHVRLVEPSAFTRVSALGVEEQRVWVVIDLDAPREMWASLGDGYRVEVRIVVWESSDVLKAPTSALFRRGDGWAVYRVEDGTARLRRVETGKRNGLEAEVISGLEAGDTVIVYPSDAVEEGVAIRSPPGT